MKLIFNYELSTSGCIVYNCLRDVQQHFANSLVVVSAARDIINSTSLFSFKYRLVFYLYNPSLNLRNSSDCCKVVSITCTDVCPASNFATLNFPRKISSLL